MNAFLTLLVATRAAAGGLRSPAIAATVRRHAALAADIDRVECQPGSKDATVVFRPGRGFVQWKTLRQGFYDNLELKLRIEFSSL